MVRVGDKIRRCTSIDCKVKIHSIVKMKFTPLESNGIYDHHKNSISLPEGEKVTGAVIDTHNISKTFEEWDDATLEVIKSEKILVFWLSIPPIPKGFMQKRYHIRVKEVIKNDI